MTVEMHLTSHTPLESCSVLWSRKDASMKPPTIRGLIPNDSALPLLVVAVDGYGGRQTRLRLDPTSQRKRR